jgi:DNA invertase Pin-like site-specific DNA recombinase
MKSKEYIAVGYVRCSTDMQEDSIEQQKKEITQWACKNELKVERWIEDEGKSGTTFLKRPGFLALKHEIEVGASFKYILVYDESRWGRANNPRESSYWKMHFERFGVIVRIINSQSKNENDIGSYVIEVVESAEASEYSRKLSRATLRGQRANIEKGYSSGGTAPYGYKRVAVDRHTGKFIRILEFGQRSSDNEKVCFELGSPEEVHTVKKIFELRQQELGYRAVANSLNKENISCPKRGRWKNRDQKWSSNTILSILSNPTYIGTRVFNRHPQSHISGSKKKVWLNDPSEWVIKENAHPAIISKPVFDSINAKRKPYTRNNRHFTDSPYLLSGLLRCKHCGFNFQGHTKKVHKDKDKGGHHYVFQYYLDGGYQAKGNSVCRPYMIPKEEVENYVIGLIAERINHPQFLQKIRDTVQKKLIDRKPQKKQIDGLEKSLQENQKSTEKFITLIRNGAELEEIHIEHQRLEKERASIETTIRELGVADVKEGDIDTMVAQINDLVKNFKKTFSIAPLHIQKNLIRRFVSEIVFDHTKGEVTCFIRTIPIIDNSLIKHFKMDNIALSEDMQKKRIQHQEAWSNAAKEN